MMNTDTDVMISFEEWCISCDIRGVDKFAVHLKSPHLLTTKPIIQRWLYQFQQLRVPNEKDCNDTIFYIINLSAIKELRENPICEKDNYGISKIQVSSHSLPFSNEIEIEYCYKSYLGKVEVASLFGYISWNYSTIDNLIDCINTMKRPLDRKIKQFNNAIYYLESFKKER